MRTSLATHNLQSWFWRTGLTSRGRSVSWFKLLARSEGKSHQFTHDPKTAKAIFDSKISCLEDWKVRIVDNPLIGVHCGV